MPRERYIQDPKTFKLIPAEEYYKNKPKPQHNFPMIMGDIRPFRSIVDGTVILGRRSLREHNRRNNVVNAEEFSSEFYQKKAEERAAAFTPGSDYDRKGRIEALKAAVERHTK